MAPDPNPIVSFRPGSERRAKLEAWAEDQGYTALGTAMNAFVDRGLSITPHDILAEAERKAAHLGLTHAREGVDTRRRWRP